MASTDERRLRPCLFGVLTIFAFAATAGGQSLIDISREIDVQVWIPMLAASNRFDEEAFLALQSPDLVRVSVDSNEVYSFDRYSSELRKGFARARERGIKRRSEVRFTARTHSSRLARDAGIFRSEVTFPGGAVSVRYTAFEMILRREQGRWKILVDQDSARGGSITEDEYLKAMPLPTGSREE